MPSRLHSTVTVLEGGGLTLQGRTTVWPARASTVSGSPLSMETPPRVKLGEQGGAQGHSDVEERRK